jgi:hypothetical protein
MVSIGKQAANVCKRFYSQTPLLVATEKRLGGDTGFAESAEAERIMAFGEPVSVFVADEFAVVEGGRLDAQSAIKKELARGG